MRGKKGRPLLKTRLKTLHTDQSTLVVGPSTYGSYAVGEPRHENRGAVVLQLHESSRMVTDRQKMGGFNPRPLTTMSCVIVEAYIGAWQYRPVGVSPSLPQSLALRLPTHSS
jgi:hypothetical protein